ncbi:NADH-quinone oxidoreductase subunit C [Alcanivorax sp.]|uniref:NADH-quinone oxidoreductase subunit C n=1 Tax=Alcanivorax sp. TaxID=1872427 RepID=UPI002586585D|nr:NADH-quinone oxidoreductase subunit C [Alcanivorax sp.]
MKQSLLDLQAQTREHLSDAIERDVIALDEYTIEVDEARWHEVAKTLRDTLGFDQLIDLCGVDYVAWKRTNWETLEAPNEGFSRGVFDFEEVVSALPLDMPRRFAVVMHLLSVAHNRRIRVRAFIENTQQPEIDSVVDVWASANWFEREAFDLFGIIFKGHPDLRRILTDYGFIGHPLRKDFPLTGHVEMRYDPEKARCVYEPVSIENRVNVPRVIRNDSVADKG